MPTVPDQYHCSINGRPYMIDSRPDSPFQGPASVPLVRAQSDATDAVGEQTLSRDDLWRRTISDWSHGTGQDVYDAPTSDPSRFRESFGVDPWTRTKLSLLPDTELVYKCRPRQLLTAGNYLYMLGETSAAVTDDGVTWSAISGATNNSLAVSDGQYVYIAAGGGLYRTSPGSTTLGTVWNAGVSATHLWFGKGRLMAADVNGAVYNVTSSATPDALFTPDIGGWTWVGFAAGPAHIYMAGYSGEKSLIYRIPLKQDGSGLDAPIVCGELPDGEVVKSISSYLGYLLIGTAEGFRIALADTDLTIGPLINIGRAVECFEGQGEHVWFGWPCYGDPDRPYHRAPAGLGRMDLSTFTGNLTPAYATDLMYADVPHDARVTAVATFLGRRYYGVNLTTAIDGSSTLGVIRESGDLVASGWVDSGWITFGLADQKVIERISARCEPLWGYLGGHITTERVGVFPLAPTTSAPNGATFIEWGSLASKGSRHRIVTLLQHAEFEDPSLGPVVTKITVGALPVVRRSSQFLVPLVIADEITDLQGTARSHSTSADIAEIVTLANDPSSPIVDFQIGNDTYRTYVDDYQFTGSHPKAGIGWEGTLLTKLKVPASVSADAVLTDEFLCTNVYGYTSGTLTEDWILTGDTIVGDYTIGTGATIYTNGYVLRCLGTLTVNGAIRNDGYDGATGRVGGYGAPGATLPPGASGAYLYAAGYTTKFSCLGGEGGNGGGGTHGTGGRTRGLPGSTVTSLSRLLAWKGYAGLGGGWGAYGGSPVTDGGAGGGGGGCVVIVADVIVVGAAGVISADGGDGWAPGVAGCGIGGGGGGGYIGLYYVTSYTNNGSVHANGGLSTGTGVAGSSGSAGQVRAVHLT